jgi:hypothetical protein
MGVIMRFGGVNSGNPVPCPDTFLPDGKSVLSRGDGVTL